MPSHEPAGELAAASPAAARLLPRVIPETPAAVLLVDTARGEVVYASPVAEQLAPDLRLPFGIEEWATAAGLQDIDGAELSERENGLLQLTRSEVPRGQILSALRPTDISTTRELLWATGVPLAEAPVLAQFSLLIFLPLRDTEAIETAMAAAGSEAEIRDRAVLATGLSFTVADAQAEDQPLIWVNPAFTAATGYTFEDAVGKNCRFLQGPETDANAHAIIRAALNAGEELVYTLLNYRKDGTPFWNQLAINPVRDAAGTVTHFVGIQTDVTERRRVEREREQALDAERTARRQAELAQQAAEEARLVAERAVAEAEDSRRRLTLLAEATSLLAGTLDLDETFDRLIRLVLPLLADWVVVNIIGTDEGLSRRVIVRDSRRRTELADRLTELHHHDTGERSMTSQVLESGQPLLRAHVTDADIESNYPTPELRQVVRDLGMHSALTVPLRARNRLLGVMTFVSDGSNRVYDEADLDIVADLGRRAALTLDNARLYQVEHQNAETLQRSLLPDLPEVEGVTSAARYLAGASFAEVGGDFYELLDLPDGAIGVAIGDVVGHDLTAAAAMGHLRGLLRACAWDTAADDGGAPGKVMRRVDRLVQGLHVAPLATVFYGRLERPGSYGAGWRLRYTNAGHPPPVVRRPDGTAVLIDTDPGMLLGVDSSERDTHHLDIEAGSTIFTYTDGLVERRGTDLTLGLEWLRATIEAAPRDATPAQLVELATSSLEGVDDDVAVLAVKILPL